MTSPHAGVAPLTAPQLALYAGWTMAVLYGDVPDTPALQGQLPTVHELSPTERKQLELGRLSHLLKTLAEMPECKDSGVPTDVSRLDPQTPDFKDKLVALNLALLEAMAAAEPETELAYELGRSLRDTANPPADSAARADALDTQLRRGRVARIQEWLATLSAQFPLHAAAIVSKSVGRWSELASVTLSTSTRTYLKTGGREEFAEKMCAYLLRQGDVWVLLLVGARPTAGLLSPEGYVAAGEAALRRSTRIVRKVLRHYWVVLAVLAIALAVVLYLAAAYLGGAAKVWTSIAAIASSLGISARAIASATGRLAAEAERPVLGLEEEDAMAWAITTMPPVDLTPRGVHRLRRAGVARTADLGRV